MLEAFAVGVRIKLTDDVSSGLGLITKKLMFAQGEADVLAKKLGSIKFRAIGGAALAGAGIIGLWSLKPALEEAMRLQEAQARFSTFGLSPAANAEALKFAMNMHIAGSSYVDNMNRMIEAQGVFRESGKLTVAEQLKGAKLAAPLLAQIAFAQTALGRSLPGGDKASEMAMLRFVEMRGGVNNAETFNRVANLGFKAVQSSGGNISWELLRQFMAHGGTAAQGLKDDVLFGKFEPIIGELKGQAGVAHMTAYNRLEGLTRVPNQIAHLLVDSGIWRKNAVIWNSLGGIKRFRDNKSPLVDHLLWEQDPIEFYQKNMLPLYQRMHLDQAGRLRENAAVFGRGGSKEFNLIDRQIDAISRSVQAQHAADDIPTTYHKGEKTARGKEATIRADIRNVEASIGMAILPMYLSGLKALEPMLWAVSTWTKEHPRQVQVLATAFIGLSVAMAFGGAVMLLSSAFSGLALLTPLLGSAVGALLSGFGLGLIPLTLVVAAVAAVGYALYEVYKHWDHTKSFFDNIKNEWGMLLTFLQQELHDFLPSVFAAPTLPDKNKGTFDPHRVSTKSVVPFSALPAWKAGQTERAIAQQPVVVHVTSITQLDGKQIARRVTEHIDNQSRGRNTGATGFDTRMSPIQPGMLLNPG